MIELKEEDWRWGAEVFDRYETRVRGAREPRLYAPVGKLLSELHILQETFGGETRFTRKSYWTLSGGQLRRFFQGIRPYVRDSVKRATIDLVLEHFERKAAGLRAHPF